MLGVKLDSQKEDVIITPVEGTTGEAEVTEECMTPEDAMSHSSSLVILQPEIRLWQAIGWNDKISRPYLLCHVLPGFLASYRTSWALRFFICRIGK